MASKSILSAIIGRDYRSAGELYRQKGNLPKAAEMFLKAGDYDQAAGLYVALGQPDKAVEVFREAGMMLEAAELLDVQGQHKEAIALFEEANAFAEAAESCLKAQQPLRAGRYFEQGGFFQRAAECFAQAGEMERALRAWERESERYKASREDAYNEELEGHIRQLDLHRSEILIKFGRYLEAAEILMEQGIPAQAAPMFERARRPVDAARAYMAAGEPSEAAAVVERAGASIDDALRVEVYLACGESAVAGATLEKMGRFEAAAQAYETAEDFNRAAEIWRKADVPARAATLFFDLGRFVEAAHCFAEADQHHRAAESFARAGNDLMAADAYLAAEDLLPAAEHYLKVSNEPAAHEALMRIGAEEQNFVQASLLLVSLHVVGGRIEAAAQRLEALEKNGFSIPPAERLYWQGRMRERLGELEEAEAAYRGAEAQEPGIRDCGQRLETVRRQLAEGSETSPRETVGIQLPEAETLPPPLPAAPAREASLTALPFDLQESLAPWWEGTELLQGKDLRSQKTGLLVALPLDTRGHHAERLRQDARDLVALRHASVLSLEEVILTDDKLYLFYQSFVGQTLGRLLARRERPALVMALNVLSQINDGLVVAHKLGLVHRWLSPNTVLVSNDMRVKVVGFGLGGVVSQHDRTARAYQPEAEGERSGGPAADVYSFGLLGVELLGALLPAAWSETTMIAEGDVAWPEELAEVAPGGLCETLIRCLAREPLDRPSSEELKAVFSSMGLVPGQVLDGRYEILGELGRGGMSRVYQARDRILDDVVAIKTLLSPAIGRSEDEERLLREVQICRKISHPNVVRVHDLGRFPGGVFVTMELLEGPGLDEIIQREAPLPFAQAKKILLGITDALIEAHRLKIVHRDLKPGNVILMGGRVKVMDFGIARMADNTNELTQAGEVIGSPMYMAPEQIQGLPLDSTCDLYALGVIAYTLVAGREPFIADSATAVVLKHLHEPPPDIHALRPDLPEPWRLMILKLLAKKPSARYPSAETLRLVLTGLAA